MLIRSIGTDDNRTPHTGALEYEEGRAEDSRRRAREPGRRRARAPPRRGQPVRVRIALTCGIAGPTPSRPTSSARSPAARHRTRSCCSARTSTRGTSAAARIDDGAGCAIVMEAGAADRGAPGRPRRTVRVVLFANEENGLARRPAPTRSARRRAPRGTSAALEADIGAGRPRGLSLERRAAAPTRSCARSPALLEPLGAAAPPGGTAARISRSWPRACRSSTSAGRDTLLRLPPHRQRHLRQDRAGVAGSRRGGGRGHGVVQRRSSRADRPKISLPTSGRCRGEAPAGGRGERSFSRRSLCGRRSIPSPPSASRRWRWPVSTATIRTSRTRSSMDACGRARAGRTHPAFYGCYDWHSSVHGHWMLARLLRLRSRNFLRRPRSAGASKSTSRPRTSQRRRSTSSKPEPAFERPYGWAWPQTRRGTRRLE